MKLAILSDVHSNYPVFEKAYNDAINKNVNKFIFLGDYLSDGFDGDRVIDSIKKNSDISYVINGNRELNIIEYSNGNNKKYDKYIQYENLRYAYNNLSKINLNYIKKLPNFMCFTINEFKICISHGGPYNISETIYQDSFDKFDKLIDDFDSDIYLFGHAHVPFYQEYRNRYFINPGSIGLPTSDKGFTYGILTINEKVNFDLVKIEYEYEELEKYYRKSDYNKKCRIWIELVLLILRDKKDHALLLLNYVNKLLDNMNIEVTDGIPDEIFREVFNEYLNKNN